MKVNSRGVSVLALFAAAALSLPGTAAASCESLASLRISNAAPPTTKAKTTIDPHSAIEAAIAPRHSFLRLLLPRLADVPVLLHVEVGSSKK